MHAQYFIHIAHLYKYVSHAHVIKIGHNAFFTPQYLQLPSGKFNIAIENDPFVVDVPIKNGDFP